MEETGLKIYGPGEKEIPEIRYSGRVAQEGINQLGGAFTKIGEQPFTWWEADSSRLDGRPNS